MTRWMTNRVPWIVAILAVIGSTDRLAAQLPDVPTRAVALSGESAPGVPGGVVFRSFDGLDLFLPPLDRGGRSALFARLELDGQLVGEGIWSDAAGPLEAVALSGDPAPGTPPGVTFVSFSFIEVDVFPSIGNGRTLFQGLVEGPGVNPSNQAGAWTAGPGPLTKLLRSGDPAPGQPTGVVLADFLLAGSTGQGDVLSMSGRS